MSDNEFSKRLSRLRIEKNISAREMSLAIGQNPGYINAIENGKAFPTMTTFFFICDFLGITPKDFFDYDDNNPESTSVLYQLTKKLNNEQVCALTVLLSDLVKNNDK